MKRVMVMLMAVFLCSLSAWCQKAIPIFSTTNELFSATITSVSDVKPILKKHGFATDKSCEITNSQYSSSAKILKSVIYNENYGTIVVEVTYDKHEYASKIYAVSFMIIKDYSKVFKSYLKKNNYKFLGEQPDFPWTQYYKGKYSCGVTNLPDDGLSVMFVR